MPSLYNRIRAESRPRKTPIIFLLSPGLAAGFSLIELVIVIAVLGILAAISFPVFNNIQKDAKIAQAKNALAVIVKECAVHAARGKNYTLGDLSSAKASLSGYRLEYAGNVQGTPAFDAIRCIDAISNNFYANPTVFVAGTSHGATPWFMIKYNIASGSVDRKCGYYEGIQGVYFEGCSQPVSQCPPPCNGPYCPPPCPPGQGPVEGEW